jgi:hypothetical protein
VRGLADNSGMTNTTPRPNRRRLACAAVISAAASLVAFGTIAVQSDRTVLVGDEPVIPLPPWPQPPPPAPPTPLPPAPGVQLLPVPGDAPPVVQAPLPPIQTAPIHKQPEQLAL